MGLGDNIMATGMAKGAKLRGKRVAFGDGRKIIWDLHSEQIFQGNPNIAAPSERLKFRRILEWVRFHRGHRIYNSHDRVNRRWLWNMEFRPTPGELYLTEAERSFGAQQGHGFVVIEPNVPPKTVGPNKQWPVDRFQKVADAIMADGREVVQFVFGPGYRIRGARKIETPSFRHAVSALAMASIYIGPEGGMHHAAAADKMLAETGRRWVGATPAVVLFGGFIPPQVTGYDMHVNLTGGAESCGSLDACEHCQAAMRAISCEEVFEAASRLKVAA
jgi:hypothetical protein